MSPGATSASARSRMTRARPSMVPAETGRPTVAPVRTGDHLAIRREHARRCERSVGPERVLARRDEPVIHVLRAHDVTELVEREVGDVLLVAEHMGVDETLGLL